MSGNNGTRPGRSVVVRPGKITLPPKVQASLVNQSKATGLQYEKCVAAWLRQELSMYIIDANTNVAKLSRLIEYLAALPQGSLEVRIPELPPAAGKKVSVGSIVRDEKGNATVSIERGE